MENQNNEEGVRERGGATCSRCHRALSDPISVQVGMGPTCRKKSGIGTLEIVDRSERERFEADSRQQTLPWNGDIVCKRTPSGATTNVPVSVVQHSPTGFAWGYGGSGPADLALNILNLFVPPGTDGFPKCKLYEGYASFTANVLYQDFKRAYIEILPHEGGTIKGEEIRAWIDRNKPTPNTGEAEELQHAV